MFLLPFRALSRSRTGFFSRVNKREGVSTRPREPEEVEVDAKARLVFSSSLARSLAAILCRNTKQRGTPSFSLFPRLLLLAFCACSIVFSYSLHLRTLASCN